jgi:hypothetical protein
MFWHYQVWCGLIHVSHEYLTSFNKICHCAAKRIQSGNFYFIIIAPNAHNTDIFLPYVLWFQFSILISLVNRCVDLTNSYFIWCKLYLIKLTNSETNHRPAMVLNLLIPGTVFTLPYKLAGNKIINCQFTKTSLQFIKDNINPPFWTCSHITQQLPLIKPVIRKILHN